MNRRWGTALVVSAGLLLAGCGSGGGKPAAAAPSTTSAWANTGYTEMGDVAYKWTASGYNCKSYQDGCFGITVISQNGCPNGVYIELAVLDSSGVVVGKANEITAGITSKDVAQAVLSPPGGAPSGAKARVSQLNCL